jgi:hypothetical protein
MWNGNEPTLKIAKELGCSRGQVLRVARQLKLKPASERPGGPIGDKYDQYIIEYNGKMTILQQADKIGVGLDLIKKRRKILGIALKGNGGRKRITNARV